MDSIVVNDDDGDDTYDFENMQLSTDVGSSKKFEIKICLQITMNFLKNI